MKKGCEFMSVFLVRSIDFLAFVMRIVSEDIIWLKNYFATLTNWHCALFLAWCVLYGVLLKSAFVIAGILIRKLLPLGLSNEFFSNLSFKFSCANPKYIEGYKNGYRDGRLAIERENERERFKSEHSILAWLSESKINPSNWF